MLKRLSRRILNTQQPNLFKNYQQKTKTFDLVQKITYNFLNKKVVSQSLIDKQTKSLPYEKYLQIQQKIEQTGIPYDLISEFEVYTKSAQIDIRIILKFIKQMAKLDKLNSIDGSKGIYLLTKEHLFFLKDCFLKSIQYLEKNVQDFDVFSSKELLGIVKIYANSVFEFNLHGRFDYLVQQVCAFFLSSNQKKDNVRFLAL